MLAVFKTGGKQYSVKSGQILKVEKLNGSQGDSVYFNDVLAVSDDSDHTIGSPLIKGAIVEAKILEQIRDKKIIVFKKRRRKNYRSTQGHRQYLTVLKIESISDIFTLIVLPVIFLVILSISVFTNSTVSTTDRDRLWLSNLSPAYGSSKRKTLDELRACEALS